MEAIGLPLVAAILVGLLIGWPRIKKSGPLIFLVEVRGHSMAPLYRAGDRLLATGIVNRRKIRCGTTVVVRSPDPAEGLFVKEIVAVAGDPMPELFREHPALLGDLTVPPDCLLVLGKHPASKDSKQWGYLPTANVTGRVIRRIGGTVPSALNFPETERSRTGGLR
ncbi:S26 family signal peptidase [Streptomyces sp. NPDC017405]|uniref:S26 family signal peptidase n=1 Tax=unclassified Streptomyces TaxID=2593676 RepID=UPI00378C9ACC